MNSIQLRILLIAAGAALALGGCSANNNAAGNGQTGSSAMGNGTGANAS